MNSIQKYISTDSQFFAFKTLFLVVMVTACLVRVGGEDTVSEERTLNLTQLLGIEVNCTKVGPHTEKDIQDYNKCVADSVKAFLLPKNDKIAQ